MESVRQEALCDGDQLASQLRVGAIFTIGPYLFPDLIINLRDSAPKMPLIIEENYTAVLAEKLKNGDLDVIIILLPAAHPLTNRKTLKSKNLEDETILMLGAGHCFRDQVIKACPACAPHDDSGVYTAEGSSLETIRHMVASGMGVTVLPCTAAGADRYSQRLLAIRRFANPVPSRVVALAWRASFTRAEVIDVLRDTISASQLSCIHPISRKKASRKKTG